MKTFGSRIVQSFKAYPFSLVAYIFTLIPWMMVYVGRIRLILDPAPDGAHDYRTEGLAFGWMLALMLASILLIVTAVNLTFHKVKGFYVKLIILIIVSNLLLCCF